MYWNILKLFLNEAPKKSMSLWMCLNKKRMQLTLFLDQYSFKFANNITPYLLSILIQLTINLPIKWFLMTSLWILFFLFKIFETLHRSDSYEYAFSFAYQILIVSILLLLLKSNWFIWKIFRFIINILII